MRLAATTLVVATLLPPAQAAACELPGEAIHWVMDYCMARLQTDDEIAASDCINKEWSRRRASDACVTKRWAKTAMCRLARQRGHVSDVAGCIADPSFVGSTVRGGGVGQ